MIDGLKIQSKECDSNKVKCESCLFGKQTREKFKDSEKPRSSRPLELIHSDVCGYFEEPTYDGFRYFVTFIDEFTHFTVVYLLKHKSDVLSSFQLCKAMASAHFGQKIACLRSGTEYYGNEFVQLCGSERIQIVATVPYTPQQNGVSERMNRTLMDKARTMVHESNLPKEFWGEAIYAATYLTNRFATNALQEHKTPFEMWFGRKPNVDKLRVFGCNANAPNP